jgi:hypothetical protein
MPGKSSQTSLLGMFMPEHSRSPGQKRPLGLPGTLEMRYFPPQLGVIRGMSAQRGEKMHKNIVSARYLFLGVTMLLAVSTAAQADPTTLICKNVADLVLTIELNEAQGSATINFPNLMDRRGTLTGSFPANFDRDTIKITVSESGGPSVTTYVVDRTALTVEMTQADPDDGNRVVGGATYTCHISNPKF